MAKRKLFWVLKNSPGLQSLTTDAPQEHIEKRGHGPLASWHDVKLGFPLPQLLELSIADKTFEIDDLSTWGAKEGWTKLKKITLCDSRLLCGLHGCEQSLRSIHLIDAKEGYESALVVMCSRTMRLTELEIQTEISRLPFSALEICGASLITLAVHPHKESAEGCLSVQDTPLDFLQATQRYCPAVTSLAINLS